MDGKGPSKVRIHKQFLHALHMIWKPEVPVTHVTNNVPTCFCQCKVAVGLSPAFMLRVIKEADSGVGRDDLDNGRSPILRHSIPNDEQLQVALGLGKCRARSQSERRAMVVSRHQDGHTRQIFLPEQG